MGLAWLSTVTFARTAHADGDGSIRSPPSANCDAPLPLPGRPSGFRHFRTRLAIDHEMAVHRGRDAFVRVGDAQWAIAKFAYGVPDRPLPDEDVDVYVLRDCRRWEPLGSARTAGHGTVAILPDGTRSNEPGLVAYRIPDASRLGPGMQRVRFVVRGDHSSADVLLDVLPGGDEHYVVSDVDGTLTESESANFFWEFGLHGTVHAHPGAAAVLRGLALRGYHVFYLTGRPEWTAAQTHAWLRANGFPTGVLRERSDIGMGLGARDVTGYKIRALAAVGRVFGRAADYGFGNTPVDVAAYHANGVANDHQYYYRLAGNRAGGERNDDYRALIASVLALPSLSRPSVRPAVQVSRDFDLAARTSKP